MESIPFIPRGRTQVSFDRDADGQLLYTLTGPGKCASSEVLNPGMLVVALAADGRRSMGDIYDHLIALGFSLDDPVDVIQIFQVLERLDAVQMSWQVESLGPIRHHCYGSECGECCEGHLVGPLSDGEMTRLIKYKERLLTLEPDLPQAEAIMQVQDGDESVVACNVVDGQCVFLGRDRLCAVHRHFSARAKPLRCQLFPLRVIETETGFRAGISPHCILNHRSFQTAEGQTAQELFQSMGLRRPPGDIVGLDPLHLRSLRFTPVFEHNLDQESYFLSLLSREGILVGEVVASADGTPRLGQPVPPAYLADVARRLRLFTTSYQHSPLDHPDTPYGREMRRFLACLATLPDEPSFVEPAEPARAFLLHSLRQFVYLRETNRFPQVEVGVQVALMGIIGALWTTDTWTEEDRVSDLLGRRIAHWFRMINILGSQNLIFQDASDYQSLIKRLSE